MTRIKSGPAAGLKAPSGAAPREFGAMLVSKDVASQRVRAEAPPGIVFERLSSRYERRFGTPPPVACADVETANRLMRDALAGAGALAGGTAHTAGTH